MTDEFQTNPGTPALFSSTVKGEKAGDFEKMFEAETVTEEPAEAEEPEAEVQAEGAEAEAEEPAVEEEAPEGETPEDKLVRETTAMLKKQAAAEAAPAAPPQVPYLQDLQEIKDQVARLGQAQQAPDVTDEPETDFLDDPRVQQELQKARESEEPGAWERAIAVLAQYAAKAEKGKDADEVRQELDRMKQEALQQQRQQYSQQVFQAGLQMTKDLGGLEGSLVKEFEKNRELDHLQTHINQHGMNLQGYTPQSLLGAWLLDRDKVTNQPNLLFAANPTTLQAGVMKFAHDLRAATGAKPEAETVSTTGAGVRVRGSDASKQMAQDNSGATPEDEIWGGILAAAEKKKKRAKAFQ